jgi:hypothetical protein
MITKSYIQKNLDTLDKLYIDAKSAAKGLLYSKLAILELCGWIEESMDTVVRICAHRTIKDKSIWRDFEKTVIKKTWGFEYDDDFKKMLIQIIGRIGIIKLERKIDQKKFQALLATLETLKTYRNNEAHTHIKGTTKRLDAPSATKANFIIIYEGLKDIDDKLRTLGY